MLACQPPSSATFSAQPAVVKVAIGATLYLAFVHFEELVLDRYGLWRSLPFYTFGRFCPWDVAVVAAVSWFVGVGVWRRLRGRAGSSPVPTPVKLAVGLMYVDAGVLVCGFLVRYGAAVRFPTGVLGAILLIVVVAVAWWLRRGDASSFADQPALVKIATALAAVNTLLFFAY